MKSLNIEHSSSVSPNPQLQRIPVLKEFLVRWAATVKSDSPKSAVRRVWGTHFKSTDHDAFTVYYASGKKKNHFRANVLAPETSRCLQEDKVFNVSWEAKVYAGNSDEALSLAKERLLNCQPNSTPMVTLGIEDFRGNSISSQREGVHDVLRLV